VNDPQQFDKHDLSAPSDETMAWLASLPSGKLVNVLMDAGRISHRPADMSMLAQLIERIRAPSSAIEPGEIERLRKENTILRGLVQHNPEWKCTYGYLDADKQPLKAMGFCPLGFPGCGCADDLLNAESEIAVADVESALSSHEQAPDNTSGDLVRQLETDRDAARANADYWRRKYHEDTPSSSTKPRLVDVGTQENAEKRIAELERELAIADEHARDYQAEIAALLGKGDRPSDDTEKALLRRTIRELQAHSSAIEPRNTDPHGLLPLLAPFYGLTPMDAADVLRMLIKDVERFRYTVGNSGEPLDAVRAQVDEEMRRSDGKTP